MQKYTLITVIIILSMSLLVGCEKNTNVNILSLKNTFINNKIILGISYEELVENLGEPKEIKYFKVPLPASEEFKHFAVVVFNDIEVEFDLGSDLNKRKIEDSKVFRFDITGDKYDINGIKVGMSKDELPNLSIKNIDNNNTPEYKILHDLKPNNYYKDFKEVAYIGGIVSDSELEKYNWTAPTAIGFAILFKDGKVSRIVFGYPTSG